jgi:hypothetical protein
MISRKSYGRKLYFQTPNKGSGSGIAMHRDPSEHRRLHGGRRPINT